MTATTDAQIGAAIQGLRERAGLTQVRLAEVMAARGHPWHQQTVVKTEKGLRPVRLTEACDLAVVLHVEVAALAGLDGVDPEHLALRAQLDRAEEADRAAATAAAVAAAARSSLRRSVGGLPGLPEDLTARLRALLERDGEAWATPPEPESDGRSDP